MPRVGSNPLRGEKAPRQIKPVVLAAVTHLPHISGYHDTRMEVVKTCLLSMTANADMDHSLVIWDNGSCDELIEWIERVMSPDILIKSVNVGKTTARTSLARMLRADTIMAYSDDDMLFYPGWLRAQIDLFEHFPNVACVSGYPVRTAFRWGNEHTLAWARAHAVVEEGRFIPDEWERQFALSIGRDPDFHREYSMQDKDYRITYKGMRAYATSHHCQFVTRAGILGGLSRYDKMAMGDERPFDIDLDRIGLRLATIERYARHMGNVIDGELMMEISEYA